METREKFVSALSRLGLEIKNEGTFERFEKYANALIEKNKVMNLTAVDDPDEIFIRHFADSLAAAAALRGSGAEAPERLIDVGCGAGFPGLPLKLFFDDAFEGGSELTLLDATAKKIAFLEELCAHLGIKNVKCIAGRAEELASDKNHRERYDLAVSRAVASLNMLSELCLPFVRLNGLFAPHKSGKAADEISVAAKALTALGANLSKTHPYSLGEGQPEMLILLIKKDRPTPPQYPRAFTRIKNKPL